MKLLLLPFLGLSFMPNPAGPTSAAQLVSAATSMMTSSLNNAVLRFQDGAGPGKMSCVQFKNQEFCRAELKDFDFDAKFSIVSATVYFSGANFRGVEKGAISNASLKPIKHLMERCLPGSNVVFDDVKVKGPDNEVRTITGLSLTLF